MNEDEALREMVRALRTDALSAAQKKLVRARLSALLAASGGGGAPPAQSVGPAVKAALGAMGLGVLVVAGMTWWSMDGPAPAPVQVESVADQAGAEAPLPEPEPPPEASAPAEAVEEAPAPGPQRARSRRRGARPRRDVEPGETETPTRSNDAIGENALLAQARAALNRSPVRALSLAEAHRERFPSGVLAQERELIAIEALDRVGRRAAARVRASSLASRWPNSPYLTRLSELDLL